MNYAKNIYARITFAVVIILSLGVISSPAIAAPLDPFNDGPAAAKSKATWSCTNVLAQRLYKAGFRGTNIREAWAIAMRESGGRPSAVSSTGDYGVFQFNRVAHNKQVWWDTRRLLTAPYNISVAYQVSKGGRTWYPWDIDGNGQHKGNYTSASTYRVFAKWYAKYPCSA